MESDVAFVAAVLALYSHIHAVGTKKWAPALINKARQFKGGKVGA